MIFCLDFGKNTQNTSMDFRLSFILFFTPYMEPLTPISLGWDYDLLELGQPHQHGRALKPAAVHNT